MNLYAPQKVVVWDRVVRSFHWILALCFLLNYALLEEGETLHEWVGYIALAAVAVRTLWGFIGPANARFSDFWPTPSRVRAHLQAIRGGEQPDPDRHNPLGGLMILALMASMMLTGISGWMLTWDMFWGEEWLEELHELLANLVALLVCGHLSAIAWFSLKGPHNLARIMLTGYRQR